MKNHILRPLWVVLGVLVLFLLVRSFMVPDDFGVHGRNFTYGFHRAGSIDEWKEFPLKYQGKESCSSEECHSEQYQQNMASMHSLIECENCHGPALNHPDEPESLVLDTSRDLCLRCHSQLLYPTSQRSEIPGILPGDHNVDEACSNCHNPHNPDLEDME